MTAETAGGGHGGGFRAATGAVRSGLGDEVEERMPVKAIRSAGARTNAGRGKTRFRCADGRQCALDDPAAVPALGEAVAGND